MPALVPGAPDVAEVTRYGSLDHNSAVEARVTVSDRDEVRRLQRDANKLPQFPQGNISCPFDDGSHYAVRFEYPDGAALTLYAEIWGCEGVGPTSGGTWTRWSLTDHSLLDDLDAIAGPSR